MKKYILGFTLLELMVVVAIVGMVMALVLAALSSARNKGTDSSIQSEMKSLQSQIELDFLGGNYNNVFVTNNSWDSSDAKVKTILTAISKETKNPTAFSSSAGWAAQAKLVQDPTKYFCVDTSGKGSISITPLTIGQIVCP